MAQRTCTVDGCETPHAAKGYCGRHYQMWSRTGDPLTPPARPQVGPAACSLAGCDRPYYGKGLCEAHYARSRNHGDPVAHVEVGSSRRGLKTEDERFWEKVNASGVCWEWTGPMSTQGYGQFFSVTRGGPRSMKIPAHRWAYETLVGPIPDGLHMDHLCRNRCCVNPDHLEPVTPAENVRRGAAAKPRTVRS